MALFSSDKKAKEKRENTGFNGQFSADSDENTHGISTISMETTITGTIETNSVFNMEGVLNGDIKGNKLVHVGKTGQVKGNITAETVVVDGEVSGEIVADKVEIGNTGKVYATITSAVFVIQEGGLFEGRKKIKIALIKEEENKGKKEDKMGIHTSQTMELVFQNVKVPAENLLGQEGKGFKIAMMTLDGGRIGVAAQALGIAEAALADAIEYSKQRVQFGKPLCKFQAISFKLAEMATKIEAARQLVYKAAMRKEEKKPYSVDAAMAKMYASDIAMEVTTDAVQIFGGYGYSEEYPVARHMRDAKITQIYEGTNEAQRLVISGNILR